METHYTREIKTPKTRQDGLANFVQMIINAIEAGDNQNALMLAVDLYNDVAFESSPYKVGEGAGAKLAALQKELESAHGAQLSAATETAFENGRRAAKAEIIAKLGLV